MSRAKRKNGPAGWDAQAVLQGGNTLSPGAEEGLGRDTWAVLQHGSSVKATARGPWTGYLGCFASEVEFSKGYRYFASVIKLAKCGSAAKVGIRRVGIAVKTAHGARLPGPGAQRPRGIAARTGPAPPPLSNETHWGRKPPIGVGNLPTPMPSCLPQGGKARHVAYPNALLPTPMREGAPRCLPQCTVTYPNAGARPPAALSAPRLLRVPLRIWAGVVRNASESRRFRRAPRGSGPKCVWV